MASAASVSMYRRVAALAVALLLVVAGFWASWGAAQHVMFPKGRAHGELLVERCAGSRCSGPLVSARGDADVWMRRSVGVKKGARIAVVVKPSSRQAVRSGAAGFFTAFVPLGGALLLASIVLAGGMLNRRLAWITSGAGLVLLTAAFVAVSG
ncbi:hypothetical protein ACIRF8_28245 [Streptomyces sp. NPDC102406]|uniref:hypothetical protein n=1 Tax=Streptomyces sp. NPDC102406 TaxID=3366171 RepID=UPI003807AF08